MAFYPERWRNARRTLTMSVDCPTIDARRLLHKKEESAMSTLAADTTPEVEQLQLALLRGMPAWRKLQLAGGMNRMVRTLAIQGLRRRYPAASAADLDRYLVEQRLGPVLAARVYGPLPSAAPDHAERAG